jgi:peroxiredoxin
MNSSPTRVSRIERMALPALLLIGISIGVFLGIWGFSPQPSVPVSPHPTAGFAAITPAPAPVQGAPAPDFTATDSEGRAVQLSGLRGAPVLIAFWATWCEPCRIELPGLNEETPKVTVLAVNYGEDPRTALAYAQALHLDALRIVMDPDLQVRDRYLVNALPTSFLVDRKGIIRLVKIGLLEKSELESALSALGGNT